MHVVKIWFVLCALLLAGCKQSAPAPQQAPQNRITGRVIDNFGSPVAGIEVRIENTAFVAQTDNDGRLSMDYAPGTFTMTYHSPRIFPVTRPVSVTQLVPYPVGDVHVDRIPPTDQISLAGSSSFVPVAQQPLEQRHVQQWDNAPCANYLAPRDSPRVSGTEFVGYIPNSMLGGSDRIGLYSVQGDGVLGGISTSPSSCVSQAHLRAAPVRPGHREGFTSFAATNLPPGQYCFAYTTGVVVTHAEAYCFIWANEASAPTLAANTVHDDAGSSNGTETGRQSFTIRNNNNAPSSEASRRRMQSNIFTQLGQ